MPAGAQHGRGRFTKAAIRRLAAEGEVAPKYPMVGSFVGCCARAVSGQAAALPPIAPLRFVAEAGELRVRD